MHKVCSPLGHCSPEKQSRTQPDQQPAGQCKENEAFAEDKEGAPNATDIVVDGVKKHGDDNFRGGGDDSEQGEEHKDENQNHNGEEVEDEDNDGDDDGEDEICQIPDDKICDVARKHLSSLKGDQCTLISRTGRTYNRVHFIRFHDGTKFVVRVPRWGTADKCTEEDAFELRSQALTMNYIRRKTKLPVPEVLAYSNTVNNDLGHPYILMPFIEGTPVFDSGTSPERTSWKKSARRSFNQ